MSTTRTRRELVVAALANLGILAAGQDPAAEDFDAVDDHVDPLVAWLEATDILDIDDIDQIPPEWFSPLSIILADDAALEFGLPGIPRPQGQPDPKDVAIDMIRLTTYGRPTYEALKINYY